MQELGSDSDVDDDVRVLIEDAVDSELIEDAMEVVDLVLLWWRDDDGDLAEALSGMPSPISRPPATSG